MKVTEQLKVLENLNDELNIDLHVIVRREGDKITYAMFNNCNWLVYGDTLKQCVEKTFKLLKVRPT